MANRRLISIDLDGDVIPQRVLDSLDDKFVSTVDLDNELSGLAPRSTTVFSVNGYMPINGNVTVPWTTPAGGVPESDLTQAVRDKLNTPLKPSGGWSSADLTTSIQSSLSKADTAVQPTALNSLAPKASPTFTGVPKAPTAGTTVRTTQIATTEFVQNVADEIELLEDTGVPAQGTAGDGGVSLTEDPDSPGLFLIGV